MNITASRKGQVTWSCNSLWFVLGLQLADRYGATLPGAFPAWDPRRIDPWGISGRAWRFSDEQATAIADALERALDDLPRVRSCLPSWNLLEILGGDDARCFFEAMANYCSRGGFEVT